MNQPKRILNKSRRKYSTSRLSSGSNGANEDGWYKTHPKAKAKKKNRKATSLVDSDCESLLSQSDDDDNDKVVALGSSKKMRKPSKFAKKKATNWNNDDSSSSDDDNVGANQSSSSSESDESTGVKKKKKKNKKKKQKTTKSTKPSNITNKQSKVQVSKPTSNVTTKSKKNKSSTAGVKSEAETKANNVSIPEDITSIDQLQWYRIKLIQTEERTKERLQPCRVLSLGEAAKHNTTGSSNSKKKVVIQYITFPNIDNGIYKTIDNNNNNSLIPFGYKSRDGISTTFNDDYLQRYINQQSTKASGLEAEKLYIKRLFMYAANMERKAREDRKRDYQAYHDDDDDDSSDNSSSDENSDSSDDEEVVAKRKVAAAESRKVAFEVDSEDSDSDDESNDGMMDDLDVPYTQAITFDPDDLSIGGSDEEEEQSNEPIRPGDVIEYYSPIFVAGDARGLRQATVLSTDPNDDMPLVLSNGEGLPTNTKVKRIKVNEGGDLLDHSGIFRPIYRFKLSKRGTATAADGVAHEAARFGKIMQKNMIKLKEKAEADGFAPMDMINGGKWNVDTSKSKQSSNSKISNRRKDDDSSSEDGDSSNSSSEDEKPRSKKAPSSTSRPALNKENNGTESSDKEKQSEGSLSSGSSLSDEDFSTKSVKAKGRKAKKSRDNHVDLSFMSDDDDNERYTSAKKSAKAIVRSTSKSTGLTFNTESSFESPTQSYKDMPISKPKSTSVSKRRLKLDCFNPAYQSSNEKKQSLSEKVSKKKEELPSSPSSSSASSDSSISANSVKRKKSRKRSASSDSVELISDTKRNIKPKATISKKRQTLSSDDESSSGDSSDDDIPTKSSGTSEQLNRGQLSNSTMSSTNHNTKAKKTREPPTQERTDLGWTKSKIGWTKKDDSVGSKSPGFSIMKANNKNGKKSPGLGIMRVK